MAKKKSKLRLVKGKAKPRKPKKPPRCKATTKAGKRCQRRATKNGACGLKNHQAQATGKETLGQREEAKHDVQCQACAHPDLERVQDGWVSWGLGDGDAAKLLGIKSTTLHSRHVELVETQWVGVILIGQDHSGIQAPSVGNYAPTGGTFRPTLLLLQGSAVDEIE